jgi:hypothetical protein
MLLDTASMYFRAFYGVPDTIRAPDGTPVNAVRGLLDFISRLVTDYRPTHLCCCWDNDWRPQWRVDLIPSYKAHRVEYVVPGAPDVEVVPDPLEVQVPVIREVLAAFGISVVGADGYEADDVIGTLATDAGMPVDVVTGDRDLFQLVDDERQVRILYIARGVGRHERVTNSVVRQVRHRRAAVCRLRGPARGSLRRAARRQRDRGEDGRDAAAAVRDDRRAPGRGRGPGLEHRAESAPQDQGGGGVPRRGAGRHRGRPVDKPGSAGPDAAADAGRSRPVGSDVRAVEPRGPDRPACRGAHRPPLTLRRAGVTSRGAIPGGCGPARQ